MAKKKLLEDIKLIPGRFYRLPGDVVRDRRFADGERLEILRAWLADAAAEPLKPQILAAIEEIKARMTAHAPGHAAE
jgi:hypothetical protein